MGDLGIIFGLTISYIVITTLVGVWSAKYAKDTTSFMTAKNLMGPFIVGVLMMSEFIGTGSTLGTAQTAFAKGISAAWNLITLGLGYLLYAFFMAPKFNAMKEYTISGALAQKYGPAMRTIVSLIMIYALTTVNVSMYTGGAATIATLLGISIPAAVYIIGVATIVNVTAGGLRGVGISNLIHAAFKYLGLIVTAIVAWNLLRANPGAMAKVPAMHFSLTGIGLPTLCAWTVANIGAVFSTQYVIQCISSLNDPAEARRASIVASIVIMPIGFFAAYIGLSARALFPDIKSVMAMPHFLKVMGPWEAGIVTSGIVAATFVTIMACKIGATALFMKDFYIPLFKPSGKHQLLAVRITSVFIGLLPLPFALYVPGLLKTIFFARALRTSVAIVAIFMFYMPFIGSRKAAMIGLIFAFIGTTLWFIAGDPWGIDNIYVGAAIPAIAMVGDWLIRKMVGIPSPAMELKP
jgi:SSS family solute:Na+ symporter